MDQLCSLCQDPARAKCSCKDSEQNFCLSCLDKHIRERGVRHIINDLSQKKPPSCASCNMVMEILCLCNDTKTRLCHNCLISHLANSPSIPHSIEPMATDLLTESPDDMRKFLEKKKIVEELVSSARSNLDTINNFINEANAAKKRIIEVIDKVILEAMDKAQKIKVHIEGIVGLLETKKFAPNGVNGEKDWADRIVENCTAETVSLAAKDLRFLIGEVNEEPVIQALAQLAVLKVVKDPLKSTNTIYFVKPKSKEVVYFDAGSTQKNRVVLGELIKLKDGGAWCTVGTGRLVYCGGQEKPESSKDSYEISLYENKVIKLKDMIEARTYPAVIYSNYTVYVFGGHKNKIPIKSCEKLNLVTGEWTSLDEMANSRSGIVASHHNGKVYLIGDTSSKQIEYFELKTEKFHNLGIQIEGRDNFTMSIALQKKIIILQKDKMYEVNLERNDCKTLKNIPFGCWWCPFSPVVQDKKIYFARYDEQALWRLDTEPALEVVKCFKL
ncbi:hypothetical protein SteCoe_17022 [Stentor coeruleus]|uniref:Uncharacterized protein n=1 Tax=Stentor coeruleus TaxID=5963 RepID=A0A1R2BZZ0_9CILI|nr:hypothetical protein SteCoe_17022 [Stentor coeruleus]